jgi:NAD(P)-dependent dehydrogenase (short-subunit alcohol dehydrogenase family)
MREDRFSGQVVLITGGGTGIGKACAKDFAKEGATVVIAGRREAPLQETVKEILSEGGKADYFTCDTSKPALVGKLFAGLIKKYGRLDVLVSNASMVIVSPIQDVEDEAIDRLVDINVKGTYYILRAGVGQMLKQGSGNIVTMSSMSGLVGHPNMSLYCATKAAIANMTRALALELATKNIRVNAVCPGTIDTAMPNDFATATGDHQSTMQTFIDAEPMKRLGTSEEVSTVVLFLASGEASFVTGACYTVDAGFTAGK